MASAFGARLRRLREVRKLTLQQVADAVGCTKAYIWELEMKDGQRPSAERIQAIAKVLGVTMEDVMGTPMEQAPDASPEDVAFFREYAGMTEEEKKNYQDVLKMMFSRKEKDGD
ncbi:helix-turn-helix domain-containing protein [Verminephrobacter eiseniae]|uniref:helix-turn-helix domain-containing protein n=1 Tax=Verminephrobacter eiseniae TaxID=364317 RepID=UPI002238A6F7|nr:helix-turn-helix transcriptional regulator [Verminephrobacter eiseniae]MCW5232551.1 XRE family transcriptional regulator [Verminephrobacter eiseniae]MCW5295883.1 XRE family transcriptional regulator [Verminephrobacter eiseniae]MCW8188072.1 XRE family transcriptional regulator [Verminephrobacter eiseniae]MCW8226319.1 XRE family transcriptional regulator [Verminephrobacter eiseniae]MCW8237173.1 XRE family transcriptional regulator [Verminephrobacter eiseniae]